MILEAEGDEVPSPRVMCIPEDKEMQKRLFGNVNTWCMSRVEIAHTHAPTCPGTASWGNDWVAAEDHGEPAM